MTAPFDPRTVANHILDQCTNIGVTVTNLKLQKLMYFCHAFHLVKTDRPLISPGFQAWQYGPVNRLVYSAFRDCGDRPINNRAAKLDVINGNLMICNDSLPVITKAVIADCLTIYSTVPTGKLVDLSHERDGPWYQVWEVNKNRVNIGMAIPDAVIRSHFLPNSCH